MMTPETLMSASKNNLNAFFGLTEAAFGGVEKLVELNLAASKAALNDSVAHSQALLGAKDVQALVSLQAAVYQPAAEKMASYGRHVYEIASTTGNEFTKAVDSKAADLQKAFLGAVDNAIKNAPAGSESAVALFKSTLAASNNAVESLQKAAKQVAELAESNLNAVASTAVPAAKPAARKR
jgi:phasin family protein